MAEGDGLLNRYTVKSRIGGSNPPLSASFPSSLTVWPIRPAILSPSRQFHEGWIGRRVATEPGINTVEAVLDLVPQTARQSLTPPKRLWTLQIKNDKDLPQQTDQEID